jgi:hypothetical protein
MNKDYSDYNVQKNILLEYLQVILIKEDWHTLKTLCNDIIDLEENINNRACFLSPVHRDKFDNAVSLVDSYNKLYDEDNIYLIFGNEQEKIDFRNNNPTLKYRSLVYSGKETSGIITRKKFEGLIQIYKNSEYNNVAVVDCDSIFIKKVDYVQMFNSYLKKATLYANISTNCHGIVQSPYKFFTGEDHHTIKDITRDGKIYYFFTDIPVYQKKHFNNFIKYIKFDEDSTDKFVWADFDWIIYTYYLLINNIMKLEVVRNLAGEELICNATWAEQVNEIDKQTWVKLLKQSNPMWLTKLIEEEHMKNVFMRVHTDRPGLH